MTIYLIVILLVCVFDQLSKVWAMDFIAGSVGTTAELLREGDTVPILDGIFHFTYVENPGMSFGLLENSRWIFMTVSAAAIIGLLAYSFTIKGKKPLLHTSLALIIGGGIGNMFDRVLLGYVVDFIDVRVFSVWKWVFNIADSAVCIGAGLLIIALFSEYRRETKK